MFTNILVDQLSLVDREVDKVSLLQELVDKRRRLLSLPNNFAHSEHVVNRTIARQPYMNVGYRISESLAVVILIPREGRRHS